MDKDRIIIDKALKAYLPKDHSSLSRAMRYSVFAGGKRFRPALMLTVCRMLGGKINNVLPAAAAVEMIHTFTLIHDDLPAMDNSDLRRGKLTCHKKFGEDIALLAGDALNTLAFKVIADNIQKEKSPQVISELSHALLEVVDGQRMDLEADRNIRKIHLKKTAALIIGPVRIAAILSGARKNEIRALTVYARETGLAFQIADDILDVASTSKILGKPSGADRELNKSTYPALLGLKKAGQAAVLHKDRAIKSLSDFGNRALKLKQIAEFAVRRIN